MREHDALLRAEKRFGESFFRSDIIIVSVDTMHLKEVVGRLLTVIAYSENTSIGRKLAFRQFLHSAEVSECIHSVASSAAENDVHCIADRSCR